uniref:Uncharacterized protein LOC104224352 isoform X2 n=1 Tax=Nicotiana sylvestris TaxID=4096 RepID=A0A1U7W2K1_NICSY|nr:PREDICTED: uncharacterized protein LOC104224352 isoform X2 [Nicotiana sylvestris]
MAVLNYCYLSVTSVATPISQDSANNSTPSSILTQTKVILPQQKPVKLSNGDVATTTKLRKYWGEDVDPLTSDDYIWNKEFMGRMKKYIQDPQQHAPSSPSAPVKIPEQLLDRSWRLPSIHAEIQGRPAGIRRPWHLLFRLFPISSFRFRNSVLIVSSDFLCSKS